MIHQLSRHIQVHVLNLVCLCRYVGNASVLVRLERELRAEALC
jgi:hypothetical protein